MTRNSNQFQGSTVVTKRATRRRGRKKVDPVGQYASDAWSLAKRTAYGLNEIRKLINIEQKFVDTTVTNNTSRAGGINYLSGIAQGTDLSNRVGDSIKVQRFSINGYISGAANAVVRILIVRDRENSGSDPVGSDILQNASVAATPFSYVNYINKDRFTILYDSTYTINTVAIPGTLFEYTVSDLGHIKYRGTTSASASAAEGSLYLATFTDLAATQPTVVFTSRIEYTDD